MKAAIRRFAIAPVNGSAGQVVAASLASIAEATDCRFSSTSISLRILDIAYFLGGKIRARRNGCCEIIAQGRYPYLKGQ